VPIQRAQRKATERGLPATFLVKDALTRRDGTERFENVIDSGLFHGMRFHAPALSPNGAKYNSLGHRPR
jgi:hypothetical protein